MREIGQVVLPAGMKLDAAVRVVAQRVRGVLGPDAGEVVGFRDGQGMVQEGRWERKSKEEEWMVALEWAW